MKTAIIILALLLAGCADNGAARAHYEMVRASCDNGQASACIELQDLYAQDRQNQAAQAAYFMQLQRQNAAMFSAW